MDDRVAADFGESVRPMMNVTIRRNQGNRDTWGAFNDDIPDPSNFGHSLLQMGGAEAGYSIPSLIDWITRTYGPVNLTIDVN